MVGNTFIQIPQNLEDKDSLKRFLNKLIQELDVAFGNRGEGKFTNNPKQSSIAKLSISSPPSEADIKALADKINEIINILQKANIVD